MFAQVIQGSVSDEGEARAALAQWQQEVAPGAVGWLGSTAGVTDDGQFLAVARFDSAESAHRNSERLEQDAWWTQTSKLFTAEPKFTDSIDVVLDIVGNPDEAGFVQIIQGRTSDPERAREVMSGDASGQWAAFRPDMLGSAEIGHESGAYTMVLYFTTEAAARAGESKEMPAELAAQMEEMNSLAVGETNYFDIKHPIIFSPR